MNVSKIEKQMSVIEDQQSILLFDLPEEAALIPIPEIDDPATDTASSVEISIEALKAEEQKARPQSRPIRDYLATVIPAMLLVLTNFFFATQSTGVSAEMVYWLQMLIAAGAAGVAWRRKSSTSILLWLGALISMLAAPMVPAFFNNGFSADWMNYAAYGLLIPSSALFGRALWRNRGDFLKLMVGLLPLITMLTSIVTASTILRHRLLQMGGSVNEYFILDIFNTVLSYGLFFLGRKRSTKWAGLFTIVIYNIAFYASLTTTPLAPEMLPVWLAWLTPLGLGYLVDRWWQKRKRVVTF